MKNKKGSLTMMIIASVGYLLFCSSIPSFLAMILDEIYPWGLNNYYAVLSLLAGMVYVTILYKKSGEKIELFSNVTGRGILEALVIGVVLFAVINFIVSPALGIVFTTSRDNYAQNVEAMYETPIATFFQVVIIAPLWEELIFRGFLLKRELRYRSQFVAIVLVAFFFGLLHMSVVQGISAFAAGLILCLFYAKRRSVGLTVMAHSFYNALAYVLMVVATGN